MLLAQRQQQEVDLQAAIRKETVDGDLNAAIKQFAAIVTKYGKTDRAVTAMALVHMAECHQKMGDAEARRIYEQVVKEYGDQKEAVTLAQARLGGGTQSQRQTNTLVWGGPKANYLGSISPDGRYLSYTDWDTGDLALHEIATGIDRHLTDTKQKRPADVYVFAEGSAISRDGTQIVYNWWDNDKAELRLDSLTANPNPRRLYYNPDINYFRPWDWSPDGKWIAVDVYRKDRTRQIGLVSIPDGSMRVLKSVDQRGAAGLFFSPEGKYLGYDLPQNDTGSERDVFVMSVDGAREIHAVAHPSNDGMMGWSPDGKWLLFASDRTGSTGLWGLPFADGTPQGAPEFLRADIAAPAEPIGMTRSGALYYGTKGRDHFKIQVGSFDFATGKFLFPPTDLTQDYLESNLLPDWSPDGRQLAYKSLRGPAPRPNAALVIRSMDTGQVRELHPKLSSFTTTVWAPDGRSLLTQGADLKGRQGFYQIDAQTGDVSILAPADQPGQLSWFPKWARDGKSFYFKRDYFTTKDSAYIQRNLATGKETELIRRRYLSQVNLSPDGRYFAARSVDESTNSRTLLLIPVAGGEVRELVRYPSEVPAEDVADNTKGVWLSPGPWAPDNHSFLTAKIRSSIVVGLGHKTIFETWRVPTDGGKPRKLDNKDILQDDGPDTFVVHPDGRRVAITVTETARRDHEIWALEHFLPASR